MSDEIRDIIAKYGEPALARWRGVFDRLNGTHGLTSKGAVEEADNALQAEAVRGMFDPMPCSVEKARAAVSFVEDLVHLHDTNTDGNVDAVMVEARQIVGMK